MSRALSLLRRYEDAERDARWLSQDYVLGRRPLGDYSAAQSRALDALDALMEAIRELEMRAARIHQQALSAPNKESSL